MRSFRWSHFVLPIVLLATPALAEEIVHFTSGTSMPVRGHVEEGDMIKVDLGDDGFMSFPRSVVDRIEAAEGRVQLPPSPNRNRMFPSSASENRVQGTPSPDRERWELAEQQADSRVTKDSKGVAVVPVFPDAVGTGRGQLRSANVAGRTGVQKSSQNGKVGTRPQGTGSVLPPKPGQAPPKTYVGLSRR